MVASNLPDSASSYQLPSLRRSGAPCHSGETQVGLLDVSELVVLPLGRRFRPPRRERPRPPLRRLLELGFSEGPCSAPLFPPSVEGDCESALGVGSCLAGEGASWLGAGLLVPLEGRLRRRLDDAFFAPDEGSFGEAASSMLNEARSVPFDARGVFGLRVPVLVDSIQSISCSERWRRLEAMISTLQPNSSSSSLISRRRLFCTESANSGCREMRTVPVKPEAALASIFLRILRPTISGLAMRPVPEQVGQARWVRR